MSDAPDISREAVEHLASGLTAGCAALDEHGEQHLDPLTASVAVDPMVLLHASAMLRALRGALDAAEAERDRLRDALKDIADERGMCAVCGLKEDMTPERRGIGCHVRDDECRWVLPEPVAVARAALLAQKEPPRD